MSSYWKFTDTEAIFGTEITRFTTPELILPFRNEVLNMSLFVCFFLAELTWFVSDRRGTNRGNQAGEGGEEAAGVDEAGAAKKGERSVGSKQAPQEPR